MNELTILEYQAKEIEDTLRLINNQLLKDKDESCLHRKVKKSIEFIKTTLNNPKEIAK